MPFRLVLVALLVLADTAYADPPAQAPSEESEGRADAFLNEGLRHYDAARYEEARESFRQGYELDPRPEFLFAMGQTERLSGDCASALVFYDRFVDSKPAKLHLDLATQMIEKCKVALASSAVTEQPKAPPPPPAPLASPGEMRSDVQLDERAWYGEPIGLGLLGGGALSTIAGATFLVLANSSASAEASSYQGHEAAQDRARRQQTVGVVGLAAGSVLLSSAALYFLLRDTSSAANTVSISASSDELGAAVRLDF